MGGADDLPKIRRNGAVGRVLQRERKCVPLGKDARNWEPEEELGDPSSSPNAEMAKKGG